MTVSRTMICTLNFSRMGRTNRIQACINPDADTLIRYYKVDIDNG